MRLRSKWLLLALPVLAVASGCSEYDQVQNIKLDEVNPEFVLPLVNDKVALDDIVRETGEKANIYYDAQGLAFIQYGKELKYEKQILPQETWSGSKVEIRMAATATPADRERYIFLNVRPYGEYSKNLGPTAGDPAIKKAKVRVTKAVLSASTTTVKLKLTKHPAHLTEDFTGYKLKGKIDLYAGQLQDFELPIDTEQELNFNNVLNSRDHEIDMALGAKLNFPAGATTTYENYPAAPNASGIAYPFSYGHSEIPIHLTELQLVDGSGSNVNDKPFGLDATFIATNVKPSKIIGEVDGDAIAYTKIEENIERKVSLFDNIYSAELALPLANLKLDVKKPAGLTASVKVEDMTAEYNGMDKSTVETLDIENTSTISAETLKVDNSPNTVPAAEKEATFVLNKQNSNFGDAFDKGSKVLKIKKLELELTAPATAPGTTMALPIEKTEVSIKLNLPFYGRAVSNKFERVKPVDFSVISKDYTKYIAGDENAEVGSAKAGVDGVTLLFRFKNGFPFDMYSSVEFLDEAKQSVMKLRLQAEDAQSENNTLNVPLLMQSGSVQNGKVVSPVITRAVAKLSRAELKVLQEKAKYVRTVYAATTPGAGKSEDVGIYKGYEIQMVVAIDLKGRLSFAK